MQYKSFNDTYIKGEEGVEENYMTVGDWVDSIVEDIYDIIHK